MLAMNNTAQDLQEYVLASMAAIQQFPDRSETGLYRELAQYSGLSESLIRQFHKGIRPNLTTKSLDLLVAAVKQALVKVAA